MWRILVTCWAALCCALVANTAVVLMTPDEKTAPIAARLPSRPAEHYQRIIPDFPQLAMAVPEDPPVPDAGPEPFVRLDAILAGVAWSSDPAQSTAALEFWREADESVQIVSLNECAGNLPCRVVKRDYRVVAIDPRHIVVLHVPSRTEQDIWVNGDEPERPDAAVTPEPRLVWCRPWKWDPAY